MTWEEIYALYCVETGWTWDYVDEELTMPRADGFIKLWKHMPPLRATLMAIGVGLGMEAPKDDKPASSAAPSPRPQKDLGSYLEGLSSAGIQVERVKKHV